MVIATWHRYEGRSGYYHCDDDHPSNERIQNLLDSLDTKSVKVTMAGHGDYCTPDRNDTRIIQRSQSR